MSLYETLGVPPDATPDEIKAAYRAKAMTAHPDKGGDEDEFKALNRANAILADPENRAHYDRTGQEEARRGPSPAQAARHELVRIFVDTVMEIPIEVLIATPITKVLRKAVRRVIGNAENEASQAKARAAAAADKLQAVRKRLKRQGKGDGPCLLTDALQARVKELESLVEPIQFAIEVGREMLKLLEGYTFDAEKLQQEVQREAPPEWHSPFDTSIFRRNWTF